MSLLAPHAKQGQVQGARPSDGPVKRAILGENSAALRFQGQVLK